MSRQAAAIDEAALHLREIAAIASAHVQAGAMSPGVGRWLIVNLGDVACVVGRLTGEDQDRRTLGGAIEFGEHFGPVTDAEWLSVGYDTFPGAPPYDGPLDDDDDD